MAQDKQTTQLASEEQQGSLAEFAWDEGTASFFGQGGDSSFAEEDNTEASQVVKEITVDDDDDEVEEVFQNKTGKPKAPTKKEAQTAKAKAEPETDDDDEDDDADFSFGNEDDDDDEPSGDEDEDEENKPKDKSKDKPAKSGKEKVQKGAEANEELFTDFALDLKDRGIFQHVEIAEDDKIDSDKLYEFVDQEVEGRVDETFEAFFDGIGDEGKDLLKHLRAGGTTRDFVRVYGNTSLNIQDFDAKDKKNREQVIAHYIRTTDSEADEDDISERIEQLEESGKAEKMAEKYFQRIKAQEDRDKVELANRTKAEEQARIDNAKNLAKYLTSSLEKTDEVKGFKFSSEDKKHLNRLLLDPKIKVGKNKYVPEFNFKLGEILKAATPEATQRLFLLAKLVDTDFDMSDFKVKAKTEATREAKSRIKAAKRNVRPSSAGNHNNGKRALAEFID